MTGVSAASFYGTSLPRPSLYVDCKHGNARKFKPKSAVHTLLQWAEVAPIANGGTSLKTRVAGRGGSVSAAFDKEENLTYRPLKPKSGYMLFCAGKREEAAVKGKGAVPTDMATLGKLWASLPAGRKAVYVEAAAEARAKYNVEMAAYREKTGGYNAPEKKKQGDRAAGRARTQGAGGAKKKAAGKKRKPEVESEEEPELSESEEEESEAEEESEEEEEEEEEEEREAEEESEVEEESEEDEGGKAVRTGSAGRGKRKAATIVESEEDEGGKAVRKGSAGRGKRKAATIVESEEEGGEGEGGGGDEDSPFKVFEYPAEEGGEGEDGQPLRRRRRALQLASRREKTDATPPKKLKRLRKASSA